MNKNDFIKKYNMKELSESDGFFIDIVYSTPNNFTKQKIYQFPICMLKNETAQKLLNANNILNGKGYRLKIWDSFRPLIFQKRMFEVFPDEKFVANPDTEDCPHCTGGAVDLTLCTIDGKELTMPTEFDHFGPECSRYYYNNLNQDVKQNVLLLENTMKECGFIPYEYEWWHFDDKDKYEIIREFFTY